MNLRKLLIWSPTILGIILLVVSQVDLYLFSSGALKVGVILSWELVLVIMGLLSSISVFLYGIYSVFIKHWASAVISFINAVLFLVMFGVGGALGAAYLNAT